MKAAIGVLALAATSQAANVLTYTTNDCSGTATTVTLVHEGLVGAPNPVARCEIDGANSRQETSVCTSNTLVLTAATHTGTTTCNAATPTSTTYTMDGACHSSGGTSYKSQYAITCTGSSYYQYVAASGCTGEVTRSGFTPLGVTTTACNAKGTVASNRIASTCTASGHLKSTLKEWGANNNNCDETQAPTELSVTHNGQCIGDAKATTTIQCDTQANNIQFYASTDCSGAASANTIRLGTNVAVQEDVCEKLSATTSRKVTSTCGEYTVGLASDIFSTTTVVEYSASPSCTGTSTTHSFVGDNTCKTTTYLGATGSYRMSAKCENLLELTFTTPDCTLRPLTSNYVQSTPSTGCQVNGVNSVYREVVCSADVGHLIYRETTYPGSTICRITNGNTPTTVDREYSGACVKTSDTSSYLYTKTSCYAKRTVTIYPDLECAGDVTATSEFAYTDFMPQSSECKIDQTLTVGSYKESASCSSDGYAMTTLTRWNTKDDCSAPTEVGGPNVDHDIRSFYVADGMCHRLIGHATGHSYRVSGAPAKCRSGQTVTTYLDNQCRGHLRSTINYIQDDTSQGPCTTNPDSSITRVDTSCPTSGGLKEATRNWYSTELCSETSANNVAITTNFDNQCYRAILPDGTQISQRAPEVTCWFPDSMPLPWDDSDDDKTGIIVGCVIGGLCFVVIVVFLIFKFCCSGGEDSNNESGGAPDEEDEA